MKSTSFVANSHKAVAAQMAQTGLISIGDLSLLTGVEVLRLTAFTKKRILKSYNEYHGKHFYDFSEILAWAFGAGTDEEPKSEVRAAIEKELQSLDCPYSLKEMKSDSDEALCFQIVWKELSAA